MPVCQTNWRTWVETKLAILFLKGVAMGCADAVPGVSGGTVAFITGIYEKLIQSIRSFNLTALNHLRKFDIKSFWNYVNGTFLVVLLSGILTAIVFFSRLILFCLKNYPVLLWAFFFGLIVASVLAVSKKINHWNAAVIFAGVFGAFLGFFLTIAVPAQTPETLWFIFLSGSVAICAMILPGISGSFILVLLSKYEFVLHALKDINIPVIIVFSSGCGVGLLSFSHLLHWMLKRYYDLTVAMLTGIMIGSLNKVWPWKQVLETMTTPKGVIKPLVENNVWPMKYSELTNQDPYLFSAIALSVAGFVLVYILDRVSAGK